MAKRQERLVQGMLAFVKGRGGVRRGAGRKPKGECAGVWHGKRRVVDGRCPAHGTARVVKGLPSLRDLEVERVLRAVFVAGQERFGFRLVQYSIQNDHLHLIVEAEDRKALSKGLQGLFVRVARALNRLWRRVGKLFADRYHDRILRTPRELRNVLVYVLNNAKKHGWRLAQALDRFTSSPWFDGWKERVNVRGIEGIARPVAMAKTWLLRTGWRLHGLVSVKEAPRSG